MNAESLAVTTWQPWVVAAAAFLLDMVVVGLLAATWRLSVLERSGLLDRERLGRLPRRLLRRPRRFLLAAGTLRLLLTAAGAAALFAALGAGHPARPWWRTALAAALLTAAAWSLGGMLVRRLAGAVPLPLSVAGSVVAWLPLRLLAPWAALLGLLARPGEETPWDADSLQPLSADGLRSLIAEDTPGVNLEEGEREMIQGIFDFHETAVREIMVPRIDMVALAVDTPVRDAIRTVVECRHSRIPLFEGSLDRVTGLLYSKDLLALVEGDRLADPDRPVGELAREAYYVPESKRLDEVLAELRARRIHMAVVIDEYGGTAGIVTLEDVIEEIVGEIEDEFDSRESLWEWVDDRTLRVDPKIGLDDLEELLGRELPRDGNETLAGLVYEAAGKVPEVGDTVTVDGLEVTVDAVEDQRILQVTLRAPEPLPGHARRREETP